MTDYVDALRTRIERGTSGRKLQPGDFAEIAHAALSSFAREQLPDAYRLLGTMALDRERGKLPADHPAATMISLVRTRELEIHLGAWVDAWVTPHHHDWEGAFQLIEGEAVQAHYAFAERERLDDHFAVGTLTRTDLRVLRPGDVTIVWPDDRTIHSVQHIPRGSFSIAVRHLHPGTRFPGYWRPGVRLELAPPDEVDVRRVKVLDVLQRTRRPEYLRVQRELVETGDVREAWYALQHASNANDGPAFDMICACARTRHGAAIEPLVAGIGDKRRSQLHTRWREALVGEPDRRVLAALYYGESKADVLALLERIVPGVAPLRTLDAWLRGLVERRAEQGGMPLGLPLDHDTPEVFARIVAGESTTEIVAALAERCPAPRVEACARALRAHPAFVGLLERSGVGPRSVAA